MIRSTLSVLALSVLAACSGGYGTEGASGSPTFGTGAAATAQPTDVALAVDEAPDAPTAPEAVPVAPVAAAKADAGAPPAPPSMPATDADAGAPRLPSTPAGDAGAAPVEPTFTPAANDAACTFDGVHTANAGCESGYCVECQDEPCAARYVCRPAPTHHLTNEQGCFNSDDCQVGLQCFGRWNNGLPTYGLCQPANDWVPGMCTYVDHVCEQ